jgi:hypothetical protein
MVISVNFHKRVEQIVQRFLLEMGDRESVLFIGTRFSNLYTSVDTPAKGRVVVCL